MNEKGLKPFDVKHLMLSTVVLTAISTGVFLSNETTTHAASIDTNTMTAVTAATNNTTEEDSTTSADAQNSESTVDQTTPETQATDVMTEETNSATSNSSTEDVQPAAEETTTQTAVTSDNNNAENITDNNTENVTDSAIAETSSVVAPTTQAVTTEETAVDSTMATPSNASTQITDESDDASTETSEANTQTAPMSYQDLSTAATADAVDKASVGNAVDYVIADRPELNAELVDEAKAAVSKILEEAYRQSEANGQPLNNGDSSAISFTATLSNIINGKNDDDTDIYSVDAIVSVKENTNVDDLVLNDELVQKAKITMSKVLKDEFSIYYLSDVQLNNDPGKLYASDVVEFTVAAQISPEEGEAVTIDTSTNTAQEKQKTININNKIVSGEPASDIVPDASDEQAKQQAAESKAAMRAATKAVEEASNATTEYPTTTIDETTDTKSDDSTEATDETVDSTGTDTSVETTTEPTDTTDATTTTKPAESTDDSTAAKPTDSSDTKAADSTESVTTQANEDSASAVTDSTVTTAASTTAVKFVNTPAASVKATDLQVATPVSTQAISETQVSPAIETKEEASSVEATDSTSDVQNATVKEASVLPQTNEKTGFIDQLMGLVILGLTFGISFVRKSRKSTNE
ncbi:LPXTG cell wall anchor domain-containing protein [Enterococcus sp. 22-H-5-01]|uniref:LPXTG cell wall anchor domain-containing protein n=1 Tax=Enterococcus sp. 22-H-5-01 TaxID=3418555 RepID=UPI003CFC3B2F